MIALCWLFLALTVSPFRSKNRLAAENAALRHQLIVLQRRVRGLIQLTNGDRLFLVMLYRWFPCIRPVATSPDAYRDRREVAAGLTPGWIGHGKTDDHTQRARSRNFVLRRDRN